MNRQKIIITVLLFLFYFPVYAIPANETGKKDTPVNTPPLEMTESLYEQYKADSGMISVPENRNKKDSRSISLPVVRYYSTNKKPAEPVFLFFGGPGQSNIWARPPLWLLKHHDLVMVGYRGVDGSVSLQIPEFSQILQMKNLLSPTNLGKIGEIASMAYQRFKKQGIDIDGYTIVEVIDDVETVRKALGYGKINLYGVSFGTRYTYTYGLRYPRSIFRCVMADVATQGRHSFAANIMEIYLNKMALLWKKDPQRVERMPDPIKTMGKIMAELPSQWKGREIDRDRLRLAIFHALYSRKGISMVFNAFAAARKGDFNGLGFLASALERFSHNPNWGEALSKKFSSYDPLQLSNKKKNNSLPGIMDSPYDVIWPLLAAKWPIKPIPQKYGFLQPSEVETLLISASLDISTPLELARELLGNLSKGHHVILAERGHTDVGVLQPEAFQHLVEHFYLAGVVDDSQFKYIPLEFD